LFYALLTIICSKPKTFTANITEEISDTVAEEHILLQKYRSQPFGMNQGTNVVIKQFYQKPSLITSGAQEGPGGGQAGSFFSLRPLSSGNNLMPS